MTAPSTAIQRVTFGVELEMLVAYLPINHPDPAANGEKRQVIRVPEQGEAVTPGDVVKKVFRDFLRSHEVLVSENGVEEAGPPSSYSVGTDSSVQEKRFTDYRWQGIEIRSPALHVEAGSFDDIKRVINLLRNNFRLRLNETTGLHVHVGLGAHPLPPRAIRRLSQFLWCADGILSQLHPPERILSRYSPSIRHSSYLGQGDVDHWRLAEENWGGIRRYLGLNPDSSPPQLEDQENPAEVSSRLAVFEQDTNSFPALNSVSDSLRLSRLPAIRAHPFEDEAARQRHFNKTTVELGRLTRREFLAREGVRVSILDGLRILSQPAMYANTTRAAHQLTGKFGPRLNYNLNAYNFQRTADVPLRMTIEFREAAGSLNPSWVVAWARICSRIVEFCLEAKEDTFVDLLMLVLEAELAFEASGESHFDIIDLLNDLSLIEEANYVEKKILRGNKNAFWFPCVLDEAITGEILVAPEGEE
ncbi:hypothetical protein J7T55_015730 [Diaporthe amygdali]|uniref:uncharacterized protein n=1 Tax=Phomopsis amygdali TaxID=1214568 RepID=UPI0022FEDF2B|nr:uncharacterized protein J7T55_015730 [Diaporthe amygdali]KAJ0120990.1 hypothetical protein J7T55_015730 [Diaporthe amygdali]